MKTELEFSEDGLTLQALYLDGQKYRLTGTADHQKSDGTHIRLVTWETHCPVCDVAFEVRCSRRTTTNLTRRCAEHKAAGNPVSGPRKTFRKRTK